MNARPCPVRMEGTVQIWRTAISAPAKEKYSLYIEDSTFHTMQSVLYTIVHCIL
jgi:hypothetical protein